MEAPYSAAFPHIQSITKVGLKTIVVEMRIFGEQDEKKVDFFFFQIFRSWQVECEHHIQRQLTVNLTV